MEIREKFQQANHLVNSNKPKEALELLEEILAEDPNYAPALNKVGVICIHSGELDMAQKYFDKALESDPDYAPALGNLAGLLAQEGKTQEALEMYQRAVKISPEDHWLLNNLAALYKQTGDLESYLKTYKKSQSIYRDRIKDEAREDLRQMRKGGCAGTAACVLFVSIAAATAFLI